MSADRPANMDSIERDVQGVSKAVSSLEQTTKALHTAIDGLNNRLARVELELRGESEWQRAGLLERVKEVHDKQTELNAVIKDIQENQEERITENKKNIELRAKQQDRFQTAALSLLVMILGGFFLTYILPQVLGSG